MRTEQVSHTSNSTPISIHSKFPSTTFTRYLCTENSIPQYFAGLPKSSIIDILATLHSTDEQATWKSSGTFLSDEYGCLDLANSMPIKGSSYDSPHPKGLICSMKPTQIYAGFTCKSVPATYLVEYKFFHEEQFIGEVAFRIGIGASDIYPEKVVFNNIAGESFAQIDGGKGITVITLRGSNGGLSRTFAAGFAAAGYSSMALAYHQGSEFGDSFYEGTNVPRFLANIELSNFEKIFRQVLKNKPSEKIVLHGVSRGAELVLELASRYPELISGVIAIAPANSRWPAPPSQGEKSTQAAWVLNGKVLPYSSLEYDNPEAIIEVEHINGPVLLVAGGADKIWPANDMLEKIHSRYCKLASNQQIEVLKEKLAGHLIGMPGLPTGGFLRQRDTAFQAIHYEFGGSIIADQLASEKSWQASLEMLKGLSN